MIMAALLLTKKAIIIIFDVNVEMNQNNSFCIQYSTSYILIKLVIDFNTKSVEWNHLIIHFNIDHLAIWFNNEMFWIERFARLEPIVVLATG